MEGGSEKGRLWEGAGLQPPPSEACGAPVERRQLAGSQGAQCVLLRAGRTRIILTGCGAISQIHPAPPSEMDVYELYKQD